MARQALGGDHVRDADDLVGVSSRNRPSVDRVSLMFLICGEALYDMFLTGESADGGLGFDARPGGSPFNVAIGMARLGARAALLTGLSEDLLGARLATVLEAEGVACDYLVRSSRSTTLSVVGVDAAGGPSYAFYGADAADRSLTAADMPNLDATVRGLHFGSYSAVVTPAADAFADLAARESERFISFDPNIRLAIEPDRAVWHRRVAHLRRRANLIKASWEDLEALHPGEDPEVIVRSWAQDGPSMVVLTRGADEILVVRREDEIRLSPPRIDVQDTVGAGDSFQAALLSQLSRQSDPASYLASLSRDGAVALLQHAARAATITCTRRGANLPHAQDLLDKESA